VGLRPAARLFSDDTSDHGDPRKPEHDSRVLTALYPNRKKKGKQAHIKKKKRSKHQTPFAMPFIAMKKKSEKIQREKKEKPSQ
jgi:hypothetical protein